MVLIKDVSIDQRVVLIIIASDRCWQGMRLIIMQVIVAHDISGSRSGDIDAIPVGQQLHSMTDIVVFEQVVPGVNVLFAILPTLLTSLRFILLRRNLSAAYRPGAFPG